MLLVSPVAVPDVTGGPIWTAQPLTPFGCLFWFLRGRINEPVIRWSRNSHMESRNDRGDRKTTICPRSTYRRLLSWVPTRLSRCLGALGEFVVRRPFLVIGASILAVLICAIGWIRFDVLSDPGTLWVPRGSSTLKHQNFVEENYSGIDRAYQVYVHATGNIANSTEGALTVESLRDVFSLDKKLKEIEVKGLGKWPKVCDTLVTGFCTESGITRFWTWSSDSFEASVAGDRAKLLRDVNQPTYPDGGQVLPLETFIRAIRNDEDLIIGAETLTMVYVLSPDITQSQMDFWTDTADRLIQTAQPSTKGLSFSSFCVKTVDNESQAAARQDIALVAGAVIVLIFVCCGMLFRFHQVESRASLAAAGVLCVVLSMVMGFGFCMGIGVPFTPMQQLAPFILLGIGVDDMFILVRGMDEAKFQNPTASLEFLFRRTMETSGVSITITSITNLVAFMLGALSSLPAVRWFCMYSGVSIFCDYLLQISFFMGVMVLNERRMRSGKMDLMPWIRKSEPEKQPADTGVDRAPEGYVSWFIDKYYAPFILNPWTRRFLLVAFLAIAGGGIYAGMNLKLGLNVSGLTRKGSKAQEYLKIRENDYLEQTAGPLGMYFLNIDVSDPEIQQKMLLSWEIAKQDGRYLSGPDSPQHNWLTKLIDFAKAHEDSKNILTKFGFVRQDRFYSILEEMLEVLVNKIWMQDMKFDEMGMISSSRFGLMQRPLGGVSSKQEMIDGASAVTRAIEQDVFHEEGVVIMHAFHHLFWASDGILKREVLVNVSLAGAGVVLVNLVLLIHPLAALLMVSAVVLVELGLVLVMWFVGVHLHIVTLLLVIMALGLGVDYPVHILHRFLTIDGESSTRRAHRALVNVGPAVGIGFVTTLSGFILLAGTKSELFGTLFVMLVTTVCLAFAVGTLYIPAMMVMTNLPPLLSEVENYETADRSLDDIEASRG